jgi:ankyrin repeat protein
MHIAGGAGNIAALELLCRFGANVNGIAHGVPPLVYMMQWTTNPAGPRWLLEHGADPNLRWGTEGEAPLHVAARRWNLTMVELLLQHGADPVLRRADGLTPHSLAELSGRHDIGSLLLAHGATDELSPLERFVASCARGDGVGADDLLRADPTLPEQLRPAHHRLLDDAAERGDAPVLETMLARGFDAASTDKDKVTALHRAAMAGRVDAVQVLLANGAPVDARDGMFDATPLLWAVEGRAHAQPGADHVGAARLLIAAGSSLVWTPPPGAPDPERSLDGLVEIQRAASRT